MRCPKCRKKVHPDDIYCIYCSASLRHRTVSADPWEKPEAAVRPAARTVTGRKNPPSRKPVSRKPAGTEHSIPFRLGMLLPALMVVVLLAMLPSLARPDPYITVRPEPVAAPEQSMGLPLAQWDAFVVTLDRITMDTYTGELRLDYTAENPTDHHILCMDAQITVEGHVLGSVVWLELLPGEVVRDSLWIPTEALQAIGITRIQTLSASLELVDGDTYEDLGKTEPIRIPVDFELPDQPIREVSLPFFETNGVYAAIVGTSTMPEHDLITVYTLLVNDSGERVEIWLGNSRCGDTDLGLYNYYTVDPGSRVLTMDLLCEVPFAQDARITFEAKLHPEGGAEPVASSLISMTLSEDGAVRGISSAPAHN